MNNQTIRLSTTKEIVKIKLYCYCRLPDDGSEMVACGYTCKLGGWFHLKCVNVVEVKKNDQWIRSCISIEYIRHHGTCMYISYLAHNT